MCCTRLRSPDWGWKEGHYIPFTRKGDKSGFTSVSQVGVLFYMLYFHQLSQLHWSCSQLPLFLPSTLGNTIHSEEEEGKGMTHICFLSGSGALGRMLRILSISGGSGQAREQEMLCHSVSFQNVLHLSLAAKCEVYRVGC